MADNDITRGCNPPTNDKFCPSDVVTRETMSAFMHRLGVNKVVDAKTAIDATNATNAANSDKLDGKDSIAYRTVVNGVACFGNKCVDVPGITPTELLELTIAAPANGVLQLHTASELTIGAPTNDFVSLWLTLDGDTGSFNGCEGVFLGIPIGANKVAGSNRLQWVDGNIFTANTATGPVVAVPAGTHTVRLCGSANVASDTYSATLSATWTAEGSATILSAGSSGASDLPAGLADRLQAAIDGE
jgi:hypothetical protein